MAQTNNTKDPKKTNDAVTTPGTDATDYADQYRTIQQEVENWNSDSKPRVEDYVGAEPQQSTYNPDEQWWNTYFPVVSQEDEAERQRKAQQAERWGLYSNALAAVANAVGGMAYGGKPVQLTAPKLDLQTWKNQLNADRAKRATAQQSARQAYNTAHNQWQTNKNSYTRSLGDWQKRVKDMTDKIFAAKFGMEKLDKVQENTEKNIKLRGDEARQTKTTVGGGNISHNTSTSGGKSKTNTPLTDAEKTSWKSYVSKQPRREQNRLNKISSPSTIRNIMDLHNTDGNNSSGSRRAANNNSGNGITVNWVTSK